MPDGQASSSASVRLDDVAVGTVLGCDLLNEAGKVLLPEGTVLTESLIESLRRRNVLEIPWTPREPVLSAEELAAATEALRHRVNKLFRHAGEGEMVNRLRELMFAFQLGKLRGPAAVVRDEDLQ
jgi:hypothetical protein